MECGLTGPTQRDSRRSWSPRSSLCTTPLTEETVADRFRFWDEAQSWAVERWKAGHVLAWLEFGMGMGRYLSACAENIKSGKVLLELTDAELEAGLALNHAMHRKKVRLAIEERRPGHPVRYPLLSSLGTSWVANEWLVDIGLTQYSDTFHACLMDARLLDNLTKRELEKHLGVTRKAHQTSIVHGITLLRMIKYDRQAIIDRRRQCEEIDCDPLVWTNQRFITWARGIDLAEYADNLRGTSVLFPCVSFIPLHLFQLLRRRERHSWRSCRSRSVFQCGCHGGGHGHSHIQKHHSPPFSD